MWTGWILSVLVLVGGALAGFLFVLIYRWLSLRLFEQASGANESTELMLGAARHVIGIAVAGALTVGWLLLLVEAAGIKPGTGLSVAGHSGLAIGILIAGEWFLRGRSKRRR